MEFMRESMEVQIIKIEELVDKIISFEEKEERNADNTEKKLNKLFNLER